MMNDNQHDENRLVENAKAAAKTAAKTALNKASSIAFKYIGAAILPIVPYVLGAFILFVIFVTVYFYVDEQMDEALTANYELGEKVANLLSGYGFKNENQVAMQEDERFYKQIMLYKELFKLSEYEFTLIQNTLLYEANIEDRINYTEDINVDVKDYASEFEFNDSNIFKNAMKFVSEMRLNYTQGFVNSFMNLSQYKKRNKYMDELVTVVLKCKSLTNQQGGQEKFNTCYRGYLVADYDPNVDKLVEEQKLSYKIKEDYLVYDGESLWSDIVNGVNRLDEAIDIFVQSKIRGKLVEIAQSKGLQEFTNFSEYAAVLVGAIDYEEFLDRIYDILFYGKLAEDAESSPFLHYYYKGYISTVLREFYKGSLDEEKLKTEPDSQIKNIELEIKLREEIAEEIFTYVDTFYEAIYGSTYLTNLSEVNKLLPIMGSNEKNISVEIEINGQKINISFDDYVMSYAVSKYANKVEEILKSEKNVEAQLEALMIVARTEIYKNNKIKNDTVSITGDESIYQNGVAGLETLTEEQKENLKATIESSRGTTIKEKGNYYNITDAEIDEIIDKAKENGNSKDSIKEKFPEVEISGELHLLGSYIYVSSPYNDSRSDGTHYGIDFHADAGTPIYAVTGGKITKIVSYCSDPYSDDCGNGFGYNVQVKYELGENVYYVYYAHMSNVNVCQGNEKDRDDCIRDQMEIAPGNLLGGVGTTGDSSGNHLHFEIRKNDPSNKIITNRENPENLIDKEVLYGKNF